MKAIAHVYASNQEYSLQEAICSLSYIHCLPELWLRKVFPGVIYANINLPE